MIDPMIFEKLDLCERHATDEYNRNLQISATFVFNIMVKPWLVKHRLDLTTGNGTWCITSSVSGKFIDIEEIHKFKPMANVLNYNYGNMPFGAWLPDHRNDPHKEE
jgi:hypothetical protein